MHKKYEVAVQLFMFTLTIIIQAHVVGGFSACFSSKDICRVCHCEYKHLESRIHDLVDGCHSYWTVQEYDTITSRMEQQPEDVLQTEEPDHGNLFTDDRSDNEVGSSTEDSDDGQVEPIRNTRGIKSVCPLNVLSSFHCVSSFPPDILHDMMEGQG